MNRTNESKWLNIQSPLRWLGWTPSSSTVIWSSVIAGLLFVIGSWVFVLRQQMMEPDGLYLLSSDNLETGLRFLRRLAGSETSEPAFFQAALWWDAFLLSVKTLQMSVLAIGFAGLAILITIIPGARSAADGTLTLHSSLPGRVTYYVIRLLYVFSRGVPELFWALLLVFVMEPGILAGAAALAIHNFGILGKLCSEIVEDLDAKPIRALRSNGAGYGQMLVYGILPQVTPSMLTYLLYRWEDIIRATIIVGFVVAGGLGREFRLSMNTFEYTEVTLYLICYVLLVISVDVLSGLLRWLTKK